MSLNPNTSQLWMVLGSGGVGKTTSAASLGLAAAQKGLKVVVITIDPAKRLAQALGLESLSDTPQLVRKYESGGSLEALWLDAEKAFERLVRKQIQDPQTATKILGNRLFKIIQNQLGGIEEYLSVERLLSLGKSSNYDLCILDTPPSQHALDFLESPKHLLKFFDERMLKLFLSPEAGEQKGFWTKLLETGRSQALDIFKRFLGQTFMSELGDLLSQTRPVHEALKRTALELEEWTHKPATRVLLLSIPEHYPVKETFRLASVIQTHGLPEPAALILNRCMTLDNKPDEKLVKNTLGPELASAFWRRFDAQNALLQRFETGESPAGYVIKAPRHLNSNMNLDELEKLGGQILEPWLKHDPNLFLRPLTKT